MLNEEKEFMAYVTAPRFSEPRLQPKYLTGKFKKEGVLHGIDQIMMIVTRGFLFSETAKKYNVTDDKGQISSEGVKMAKEMLNRWCGFSGSRNGKVFPAVEEWFSKYPEADGWLREFWIYNYSNCVADDGKDNVADKKAARQQDEKATEKRDKKASKKCDEKSEEKWADHAKKWGEAYNASYNYMAETVTFENVIAAALEKGPLRERYIAVKKDKSAGRIKTLEDICDYVLNCKDGSKIKKIRMLMNVIAFRIWQSEHPGNQKEVLNQKLRLLNWYGLDDTKGEKSTWCFSEFKWKKKSIMHSIDIPWNDFSKFGIDTDYLEYFGFELINPGDAGEYRDGYLIIMESGESENSIRTKLEILNA